MVDLKIFDDIFLQSFTKALQTFPHITVSIVITTKKLETMKVIKLMSLMLMVNIAAIAGKQKDLEDRVNIVQIEEGVFNLIYVQDAPSMIDLKIVNSDGQVVLEEKMKRKTGFKRNYDLTNLKEGTYLVRFAENGKKIEKEVSNNRSEIASFSKIGNSDKVRLSIGETFSEVTLNIYDDKDRLIHQEFIPQTEGILKIYDLSKVISRKVSISLVDKRGLIKRVTF